MSVKITESLREEQRAYYALVAEAEALGIPTSLDDPRTPRTTAALRAAVAARREWREKYANEKPSCLCDAPAFCGCDSQKYQTAADDSVIPAPIGPRHERGFKCDCGDC